LLVELDFLPLVRIEITNYVQELLLLCLKSFHHRLISDLKFVLLLMAHVSKFFVGAFQGLLGVICLFNKCHELRLNIGEIRADAVQIKTALLNKMATPSVP
jgi:hypothetical protein